MRHGRLRRSYVSKEVILSAGTIGSPKLLLASGIGPEAHLKRVGVSFLVFNCITSLSANLLQVLNLYCAFLDYAKTQLAQRRAKLAGPHHWAGRPLHRR